MIDDIPKGAPWRCRLGRHIGQEHGGLMVFKCDRCGGSFWQTDPKYRRAMDAVRSLEDAGDMNGAIDHAERVLGREIRRP